MSLKSHISVSLSLSHQWLTHFVFVYLWVQTEDIPHSNDQSFRVWSQAEPNTRILCNISAVRQIHFQYRLSLCVHYILNAMIIPLLSPLPLLSLGYLWFLILFALHFLFSVLSNWKYVILNNTVLWEHTIAMLNNTRLQHSQQKSINFLSILKFSP